MKYVVCLFLAQIGVGSYALGLFLLLGIAAYLYISKRKIQAQFEELIKNVESGTERKFKPRTRTVEPDERAVLPIKSTTEVSERSVIKTPSDQTTNESNPQINIVHQTNLDHFQPIIEHVLHKKNFLKRMKKELQFTSSENSNTDTQTYVNRLSQIVDKEQKMEKEWAIFNRYFQQVHPDFQERLMLRYPKLRSRDVRLCCLLRMDLSTKEIAPLLNISIRGTEISRYRLRKKLSLHSKSNLVEHIRNI